MLPVPIRENRRGEDIMAHLGKQAIVIGASMGGLLAARALADYYDEVTVLERDVLPQTYEPRKGVPQGRHTHGLLARGREILEQWFPGFTDEMIAQGTLTGDLVDDGLWFNHGCYLRNVPSKLTGLGLSRPMLEGGVKRRLMQTPNVRVREQCDVLEPVVNRENRICGVRVRDRSDSNATEIIGADLVVDACGRGSPSPGWLATLGYSKPREEQIKINLGYMSRLYRRLPEHLEDHLHGKRFVISGACEPDWRFGALMGQEDDRWIVTLGGYLGDQVPTTDSGFLEFAQSLQKQEIFNVINNAEPLNSPTPYVFNASVRRHYEELSRFPEGFLVYGDALCSFNPVFGQGMTVACMQSLALRDCLEKGREDVAKRFFRAASRLIDIPWQIAVGSDLQNSRVEGRRTMQVRFINWYIAKFFRAAQHDGVLATKFLEVANLTEQPASLMSPSIALLVWKGNRLAV
jgi:2-polyprenyl-6-methoxyphenol hydroxylase-like FAD-dependent oxidoreductase